MSRPWMPLYIADYLADTAHLGALQSGAYLHLIMHYWTVGCLPADDRSLARIARLTGREFARLKPTLQAFFFDGWKHKRIDAELAKAADISEKRRASVSKRYDKSSTNVATNVDEKNTHARASSQPQPHNISSLRSENRARETVFQAEFESSFWPAYPHKVGRKDAAKAFLKARLSHELDAILGGLQAYIAGKPPDRPWLNPATFLNGQRFLDLPAADTAVRVRDGPAPRPLKGFAGVIERLRGQQDGELDFTTGTTEQPSRLLGRL